jgi:hypothetical protein
MEITNACSKALTAVIGLLALGGCTQLLQGDAVSFYEEALPMGESIRIEALDPEKGRSLEFRSYARMVADELRELGYQPQEVPGEDAELIAQVDYSVISGSTETRTTRHFPPYVHYHFAYGDVNQPFWFGFDNSWTEEVTTTPTFLRQMSLNIVRNDADHTPLFEGRVRSSGRQRELARVMPYLVTALFENFPGENGVTKVVTIEMDE